MKTIPLHERTLARLLREQACVYGDKPFLMYYGRSFSYAEAYELSRRIASGLLASGIQPKQHVAVMMENRPETVWLNFALALIGAVTVPINNASRGDLLAYYARQSDAVALVIDESFVERFAVVESECPLLKRLIVFPDETDSGICDHSFAHAQVLAWDEIADAPGLSDDAPGPEYSDTLQILYSSGTTGVSKGSMIANATAIRAAQKHVEVYGYTSEDIMYTCLPMFHGNALNCTVLPALLAGATVALSRRFSTSQFWREINECKATRTSLLSAMINFLWLKEPSQEERSHSLKTALVVPAPEFAPEFEQRFDVKITSLYALGDFGYATMFGPDDPREKIRSAGRPLPEVSLAILDDDDQPVAPGQVGQICLRTNEAWFARQGYYKMPEVWVSSLRNYWLHTGDMGRLDEEGYLYFAGRNKELIRRRGENISALQVEEVIRRHQCVADVAVFAVRAEFLEDEVMASVVCREGSNIDLAELIQFCAPQMAYFMVPRFVELLPHLPLTATGKVEKYKLRESAETRLSEVWDREQHGIRLEK
ncbi:AMP-binding protein [Paraburkholderia sp. HD33-4]|uniref:AMP-binding protein n=1 Tax=Paraburkholderia sp. HD33-4 TaxID=2883242 RepID=UPI001F232491|nr:AMP-binding protein [Paraburkholderia sp. HD33-4]